MNNAGRVASGLLAFRIALPGDGPQVAFVILMPLSQTDFDPTEAAIVWKLCAETGVAFQFATPTGEPAAADDRMLTGRGLGPWKAILQARSDAIEAYRQMTRESGFQKPLRYEELRISDYAGLVLHGGHAPGMRPYLESDRLHRLAAEFLSAGKPVGAICHGVLLAARARDGKGRSILFGRRVTTLLRSQEMAAYNMTRLWLGTYYRTYPDTTCQDEVVSNLRSPEDFVPGPRPLFRDSEQNMGRGFTVRDGNLLTARWPGDAYNFGKQFRAMIA